jgi:hypothetical protein
MKRSTAVYPGTLAAGMVLALGLAWCLRDSEGVWAGQSESAAELRKLLRDPLPQVRLRSGLALAGQHDPEAIGVLIDLLAELPPAQRQPIEQILLDLAGEWAPKLTLTGDDDVARGIRRDAWASWWRRTDGESLLAEFRKRTLSSADIDKIQPLLRQVGAVSFRVREQAMTELMAYGAPVVPLLRAAIPGADLETRLRLERCLQTIAKREDDSRHLPPTAARLLALRKPAGAVEVLLAFLPFTEDEHLAAEVQQALTTLAVGQDAKADAALLRALEDAFPVRRAVAAEVLTMVGPPSARAAVRKLLTDRDPAVRLGVAVALVHGGDREAVPVLIDLAAELPEAQTCQAKDLLRRMAGPQAPTVEPGSDAQARQQYRAAWREWWKEHGGAVNLAALPAGPLRKAKVQARASNSWEQHTPDAAFDGNRQTVWSAGDYAPQWIEADLGACTQLASIDLLVTQLPDGETTHEIWVSDQPIGADRARAKRVHTFQGPTADNQTLHCDFPKETFARYVQIHTTRSPSWVAWVEVELRVGRPRFSFAKPGN